MTTLKRVVSGIRPTGNVTLGNYLGAMRQSAALQDAYECFYFVADQHAITEPFNPKELGATTLTTAALYRAVGIDPKRATLFIQSTVPAHAELARLIGANTPFGLLRNMIQFKEKSVRQGLETMLGLLDYPVLMTADILLYDAELVPVGADQKQHLQLARDLASSFNVKFGCEEKPVFLIPEALVMPEAEKIMSLRDGNVKMSKSDPSDQSRINLLDPPDQIRFKLKRATTDSIMGLEFGNEARPEAHNLLTIYQLVSGKTREEVAIECAEMGFGKFKPLLAEAIIAHLEPIQARYAEIMSDKGQLLADLRAGRDRANEVAAQTLKRVRAAMGLLDID